MNKKNWAQMFIHKKKKKKKSNELPLSKCEDVHAVAGLLKLYLRELPDPLLTHRFYSTFVAVQSQFFCFSFLHERSMN